MLRISYLKASSRVGVIALVGGGAALWGMQAASADEPSTQVELPATIEVTGIVRDFREHTVENGHPDFERRPRQGFGRYCANVAPRIGDDRKPEFTGTGYKLEADWQDRDGRNICYTLFDPKRGDREGRRGRSGSGGIESADSFFAWYHDVLGVNMSAPLTLTLVRQADGQYVFDDRTDPRFSSLGGFFPLEDQLLGNPGGSPDRNFHFTVELHMEFEYDKDADQFFLFRGDDDVWVYINDELVIDLGGVHMAAGQHVDIRRMGLEDGEVYAIDFFFAERHRNQSNFRIETNLPLRSMALPSLSHAFD